MHGLTTICLLVGASAFALGAANALLLLAIRIVAGPSPPRVIIHWRPLIFVVALFWFWYLTPTWAAQMVENQTVSRVVHLLGR